MLWVVNPLSLSVQANGKKTLFLDLRNVNKFLRKTDVKYEDWKTAMSMHIPKFLSLLRSIGASGHLRCCFSRR